MANTYILIEGKTLSSTTTSVTFSSIPQTYTDLLLKVSARASASALNFQLNVRLNNSTTGYTARGLYNLGTTNSSYNTTIAGYVGQTSGNSAAANVFGNAEIYVPNYAGSTNKSYSADNNASSTTQNRLDLVGGLLSNTAAVTSLVVATADGTSFLTNSTFYLYGIKNS
jgi:hypothetical protein